MSITGADIKKIKAMTTEFLNMLYLNLDADVSADTNGVKINLKGDDAAIVIGFHGETLADLAYILSTLIKKKLGISERIKVDVAGYLDAKDKKIKEMTLRAIEKVRKSGFPESLEGLNSYERRVAHTIVESEGLVSESTGFGKERKLVVKPRA